MDNQKNFLEIFKRYSPSQEHRDILLKASNIRARKDSERRMVEVYAFFSDLIPKQVLYAIEDEIRDAYSLESVRIFPSYPANLFGNQYMNEVITELYRIGDRKSVV